MFGKLAFESWGFPSDLVRSRRIRMTSAKAQFTAADSLLTLNAPIASCNSLSSISTLTRFILMMVPSTALYPFTSEVSLRHSFDLSPNQELRPFVWAIHQHIRRGGFERVRSKTVGAAHGIKAGILSGEYIYVGIADQYGFRRLDVGFTKQHARAEWIRLLGLETVASVHLEEEWIHTQRIDNCARRANRLVTEHRHFARKSFRR